MAAPYAADCKNRNVIERAHLADRGIERSFDPNFF